MAKTILKTLVKARALVATPEFWAASESRLDGFCSSIDAVIKKKKKHYQLGLDASQLVMSMTDFFPSEEITVIINPFDANGHLDFHAWAIHLYDMAIQVAEQAEV